MHRIPTAIVIDDDVDMVQAFCEFLRLLDIDVVGSGRNGKEAIELYIEKSPDIVFLDLVMPEYDGFFALQGIKAIDSAAKVVVLTANASQDVIKMLQRLEPYWVIFKPFEADQIIDAAEGIRSAPKIIS